MTDQSEPQYRTYAEHDIPHARHTEQQGAFTLATDETVPGARGQTVWRHRSLSGQFAPCRIVRSHQSGLYFCDHPAHVQYNHAGPCKHLQNLLYWTRYLQAWRGYLHMTTAELEQRRRDFARTERGVLVPYRHWEIDRDALLSVLVEREGRAA